MNTKSKAVKCPRQGCRNKAIIDPTYGVLPCQKHQDEDALIPRPDAPEFYNISKLHRIQQQRDTNNKDILQPYLPGKESKPNPDFVREYPDQAKNYFSNEELSKM